MFQKLQLEHVGTTRITTATSTRRSIRQHKRSQYFTRQHHS